jgi:glycosyltransferase involved in cell wall biosynthesis
VPRLSLVTVCLNDRAGLARTLDSVAAQGPGDFELVVVDGGSTDGSVEEARTRGPLVGRLVSERDAGIYDAQNKGAGLATGEYLLFLNAGDRLAAPDALARFLAAPFSEDLVYGNVVYSQAGRDRPVRPPDRPELGYLMKSILPTQATLWKRALFDRLGRHDLSYRICADYDLLLRALFAEGASSRHVPVTLAVHYQDGLSARPESKARIAAERARAQERWIPAAERARHAEERARAERSLPGRARAALRPLARRLRGLSRRLRGLPE